MSETNESVVVRDIRDRIDRYNSDAANSEETSSVHRIGSSVAGGIAVYAAMKGVAEIAALETVLAVLVHGFGVKHGRLASRNYQRAAELEGALAQHELATNTLLLDPPAATEEASTQPVPESLPPTTPSE